MSLARAALCAVSLVLAACTAPSSEAAAPSSTPFSVGDEAEAIGCGNEIDLLAPDGSRVNLTGLWTEADAADLALWNIRQVGDCFFMVFRDPFEDTDYSDQICDGRIRTDFQITGRCVDFRGLGGPGANYEARVFDILFDATNEVQLQKCPVRRTPGSCEPLMIRFDPEYEPAETASPS